VLVDDHFSFLRYLDLKVVVGGLQGNVSKGKAQEFVQLLDRFSACIVLGDVLFGVKIGKLEVPPVLDQHWTNDHPVPGNSVPTPPAAEDGSHEGVFVQDFVLDETFVLIGHQKPLLALFG
jgi:hypothetical protein